jgi:DNA-binding SARP family transcriptional activator
MRPEAGDLVSVLALLALAVLLLPKHRGSIGERLRAVARGERLHLFAPPAGHVQLEEGFVKRWWQLVRCELPRMIELGIALHVVAMLAEQHGGRRRRARDTARQESAAWLLLEHLSGRMNEATLGDELRARGLPTPTPKLTWSPPARLTMPPMSWRTEWERHLDSLRRTDDLAPEPSPPRPAVPAARKPAGSIEVELEIETLGKIRLCADGEDFAPRLLHRPAQAASWLYLLARQAHRPGDRLIRGVFADEMFPGLSPDQQRRKVRQRLADMNRDLPRPLRRMAVEGEYLGLDLTACDLDVRRVLDVAMAARTIDVDDPLATPTAETVAWALRASAQEFLPGWEEIERRATDGRSGMGEIVTAVRDQVLAAHLSLLETLADARMERHQPAEAIPHLEEALRRRPERGELAHKLAAAYERAGLSRRAIELRQEYGLGEPPTGRGAHGT